MAEAVTLHVYDLSMGMARSMSMAIIGRQLDEIPHTGIVCWGKEFFYSGGIQVLPPHRVVETFGMRPVRSVPLGSTSVSEGDFRAWLRTISHKYTMEAYDLFRNNCNNFSDEAAKFLLGGRGIPASILDVPSLVLSTPSGAMIAQMMTQWQGNMNARAAGLGASADPFAAMARAPLPGDAAAIAPEAAAAISTAVSAAAAARAGAITAPPVTTQLQAHARPLVSAEAGNVAAVVARLQKVHDMLPSDSPCRLDATEAAVLSSLSTVLAAPAAAAPETVDAACRLVSRVITQWVPVAPAAAFPALCALRLLVLHERCLPALTLPVSSALAHVVERCAGADMYGAAAANMMALSTLANVFKTDVGAAWAHTDPVKTQLIDLSLRELRRMDAASKPEQRQLAAALAYNMCGALPLGSDSGNADGAAANSASDGDATVLVTDTSVQLLCGLLEDITSEKDDETLRRRLLAAGRLMLREGSAAGALMSTLGIDAGVRAVIEDSARTLPIRSLAQEVTALIKDDSMVE